MRGWPLTTADFSGGLNTLNSAYMLQGNQTPDALNVHSLQTGELQKRPGFVTLSGSSLSGSPVKATGVHTLFPCNTSSKSLIGVATTSTTDTVFKLTTAGVASVLKSGMTANTRWWFAQAEVNGASGPIFGLNGVDTPKRWDGSAAEMSDWVATTGTVPKEAKYLTYWSSRLWCAKGSRLYYSGITGSTPDPLNWNAENFVDLEPNDGQEITGIGVVGAFLIVFKARKTYRIYDPNTAANLAISNSVGCIAPRSIVQTPEGLFFLSEDQGVCRTDGSSLAPFSDPIKPTLDLALSTPATAKLAAGTLSGRRYFLSVSLGGSHNDHTLELDLIAGAWWLHDCSSNQFALLDPSGTPILYSADSAAGRVSKAFVENVYQDNEANYAGKTYYRTPDYAWGSSGSFRYQRYIDPHKVKRVRDLRVDGKGTWTAYIHTNFTNEWTVLDSEIWGVSGSTASGIFAQEGGTFAGEGFGTWEESTNFITEVRYPTPGLGRSVGFKYENNDSNPFTIFSQTVAIDQRQD